MGSSPDSVDMTTLGGRLQFARELAGISARDLDRLAGRPEGHARLIERGDRPRNEFETILSYAEALGVSLEWLGRGRGESPTEQAVRDAVEVARAAHEAA